MEENYLSSEILKDFFRNILLKNDVAEFSATAVADGLIHASLRGVDSHGIRLFPHYLAALKAGRINPKPKFSFNKTSTSTGILDADNAYGHAAGSKAVSELIKIAEVSGMGSVAVQHSSHFGAASFFGLKLAEKNMLGFSFTHSDPLIAPTRGKKPYLGNNPICFTAPCEGEDPICLDMATSVITFNKVLKLKEDGVDAPLGTGLDEEGNETTDPNKIVSLLPVGGYKGYGLSLIIEVLCALLSGMPFGPHIGHMYNDPLEKKRNIGHFFMAIKIDTFVKPSVFKIRMKKLVEELRNQEPIDKHFPILVAGDPEKAIEYERLKNGIPLGTVEKKFLIKLSKQYNIFLKV